MIIDRGHKRWALGCCAAAVAGTAAYVLYAQWQPGGARGGTWPGLFFAGAGTAILVAECLLGLRKRYPASPLGRVSTWMKAHLWLGLLCFLLILFHAGFRWGGGLAAVLMWLLAFVVSSGIVGAALQQWLPRRITELAPHETVYDQIPQMIRRLRLEADERVEFLAADLEIEEEPDEMQYAGGVKQYFEPAQKKSAGEKIRAAAAHRKGSPQIEMEERFRLALRAHYLAEVRPFLFSRPSPASAGWFASAAKIRAYFGRLRTLLPPAAHPVLEDVESICEERRQFAVQARLHHWLHGWLYLHVPLSMALLVLALVHAVVSLRY